jgi:hypothetical protein
MLSSAEGPGVQFWLPVTLVVLYKQALAHKTCWPMGAMGAGDEETIAVAQQHGPLQNQGGVPSGPDPLENGETKKEMKTKSYGA